MIRILQADITTLQVDAIVNAANSTLLGGGGVDGAIHRAAGPELKKFCATVGGCPTGEARITPGFKLPARFVIHTVGPVWSGGTRREAADATSLSRGPRLDPIGEAADATDQLAGRASAASRASVSSRGPIADAQDARMPRRPGTAESGLDPIGEAADATTRARGPRLDPIGESTLLANCYRNSFELALRHGVRSIAFPSISTGVYGYPKDEAARIALSVMREYRQRFDDIIACCFSAADRERYERLLATPSPGPAP